MTSVRVVLPGNLAALAGLFAGIAVSLPIAMTVFFATARTHVRAAHAVSPLGIHARVDSSAMRMSMRACLAHRRANATTATSARSISARLGCVSIRRFRTEPLVATESIATESTPVWMESVSIQGVHAPRDKSAMNLPILAVNPARRASSAMTGTNARAIPVPGDFARTPTMAATRTVQTICSAHWVASAWGECALDMVAPARKHSIPAMKP